MNQEQRDQLRDLAEDSISYLAPTVLQLLDYIETLEKDAARYRYLRDDGEGFDISVLERDTEDGELWVHGYPPEELEAAIDAAMQGETE